MGGTIRTKVIAMSTGWDDEFGQRTAFESRVRSMRRRRLAISTAAVVLGVVLVATGHTLVGVIISGLSAARLVILTRFPFPDGRARRSMNAPGREWLRAQARDEFLVAAQVIGCPGVELRDHFQQGKSIADVATERSVAVEQVTTAIAADLTAKARGAADTGTLSHDDAHRIHELAPRFANRLVHGHPGDLGQPRRPL